MKRNTPKRKTKGVLLALLLAAALVLAAAPAVFALEDDVEETASQSESATSAGEDSTLPQASEPESKQDVESDVDEREQEPASQDDTSTATPSDSTKATVAQSKTAFFAQPAGSPLFGPTSGHVYLYDEVYEVYDEDDFGLAISAIDGTAAKEGTLVIMNDIDFQARFDFWAINNDTKKIQITGLTGNEIISLGGLWSFYAGDNRDLFVQIDHLTLDGGSVPRSFTIQSTTMTFGEGCVLQNFGGVNGSWTPIGLNAFGGNTKPSTLNIDGAKIINCGGLPGYYGAISAKDGSTINMYSGEITGSKSGTQGIASTILLGDAGSTFNMYGGSIHHNGDGNTTNGNIYVNGGAVFNMYGGEIYSNRAMNGAGIYGSGDINLVPAAGETIKIYDNNASVNGGGIALVGSYTYTIQDVEFYGNEAQNGAGIYVGPNANLHLSGANFHDNYALLSGAGIGLDFGGDVTTMVHQAENLTFSGNRLLSNAYYYDDDPTFTVWYENTFTGLGGLSTPFDHLHTNGRINKAFNNMDVSYVGTDIVIAHDITYYSNNGSGESTPSEKWFSEIEATAKDNPFTVPTGKYFKEWNTWPDGKGTGYQPGEPFTITGNTTLYAIWGDLPPSTFTLTWDTDGGDPTPPVELLAAGAAVTKPATNPEKTGYRFVTWLDEDDVPVNFNLFTMPAKNYTLTAYYTINKYTITVDWNLAGQPAYPKSLYPYDYNVAISAPPEADFPANSGYTFAGFTLNGGAFTFTGQQMPAHDFTLVAQWTKDATTSTPTTTPGGTSNGGGGGTTTTSTPLVIPTTSASGGASSTSSTSSTPASGQSSSSSPSSGSDDRSGEQDPPAPTETVDNNEGGGTTVTMPDGTTVQLAEGTYTQLEDGTVVIHDPNSRYFVEDNGTVSLFDNEVPLGGLNSIGGWGLINLILAVIAAGSAVANTAWAVVKQRLGETPRIATIASGLLPLLFFLMLETKTQMILVSRYTPLAIALFLVHAAAFAIMVLRGKNEKAASEEE